MLWWYIENHSFLCWIHFVVGVSNISYITFQLSYAFNKLANTLSIPLVLFKCIGDKLYYDWTTLLLSMNTHQNKQHCLTSVGVQYKIIYLIGFPLCWRLQIWFSTVREAGCSLKQKMTVSLPHSRQLMRKSSVSNRSNSCHVGKGWKTVSN